MRHHYPKHNKNADLGEEQFPVIPRLQFAQRPVKEQVQQDK